MQVARDLKINECWIYVRVPHSILPIAIKPEEYKRRPVLILTPEQHAKLLEEVSKR